MIAQKSRFEWFLLAHFFLKPGIQIAKRYRWGHSLVVRSMKSQNVALDLHVGCVTSRGAEKAHLKADSFSPLLKPIWGDLRKKLSCNIPCKGSGKLETSWVPLHRGGQRRGLWGAWISAPDACLRNSVPLPCATLSLYTWRQKPVYPLCALLSLFLGQTYVHFHALLSCILLTAPALSHTHTL